MQRTRMSSIREGSQSSCLIAGSTARGYVRDVIDSRANVRVWKGASFQLRFSHSKSRLYVVLRMLLQLDPASVHSVFK